MERNSVNQVSLLPLFGVNIENEVRFSIDISQYFGPIKIHLLKEPVRIDFDDRHKKQDKSNANSDFVEMEIQCPTIEIALLPWNRNSSSEAILNSIVKYEQLPKDFDTFDSFGDYAVRASQQLDSFAVGTDINSKKVAPTLLIITSNQKITSDLVSFAEAQSPHTDEIIEALFASIRLVTGGEPYPFKAYFFVDGNLTPSIQKWSLMELNYNAVEITSSNIALVELLLIKIWSYRSHSRNITAYQIFTMAMGYYFLASTISEQRTCFMLHMIAFEALCKINETEPGSAAASRAAKLISESKREYKELQKFIWNPKEKNGFFQIRNEIVHGGLTYIDNMIATNLRTLIRRILINIAEAFFPNMPANSNYYDALHKYAESRFNLLPNN